MLSASPIEIIELGSLRTSYSEAHYGALSTQNSTDTYTFTLTTASELDISLSKMTSDTDLVLKRGREIIGVSRHVMRETDEIRKPLPAGTYQLLVVAPDLTMQTSYRLAMTSKNAGPRQVEALNWGGNVVTL